MPQLLWGRYTRGDWSFIGESSRLKAADNIPSVFGAPNIGSADYLGNTYDQQHQQIQDQGTPHQTYRAIEKAGLCIVADT